MRIVIHKGTYGYIISYDHSFQGALVVFPQLGGGIALLYHEFEVTPFKIKKFKQ